MFSKYAPFFLPVVIFFACALLNIPKIDASLIKALIHMSCQSMLIWGLIIVFQKRKLFRILLGFLIAFSVFTQIAYGASLSLGHVMSVLTSSIGESFSFLQFNLSSILLSVLLFIGMVFLPVPETNSSGMALVVAGGIYVILPAIVYSQDIMKDEGYSIYALSGLARGLPVIFTAGEYFIHVELGSRFPALKSIKGLSDSYIFLSQDIHSTSSWTRVTSSSLSSEILVVGIGESLRADNMSLYGYERNTTPYLLRRSKDMAVYTNAYAAGTNTWSSIPAALTKASSSPDLSKSIINLAKDAGYKTVWLSNHDKLSQWDFSVTSIAEQSDVTHYLSDKAADRKHDILLVPKLSKILESRSANERLLVILHFYGSHMTFRDRYPVEFEFFKGEKPLLNDYDNSILYSDYVQEEVMATIDRFGGEYLFFADHGLTDPSGKIPLRHDVRSNPDLNSIKVPLFISPQGGLDLDVNKPLSLYYFECIFSQWSGINAAELSDDDYCSEALNRKDVIFVNSDLSALTVQIN